MTQIAKAIRTLSGVHQGTLNAFDAEVVSLSIPNRTAVVNMVGGNSANTITVRLMASVDDGALLLPKVGSTVVVHGGDRVAYYIALFSEVESIVWLGGEYDGVPIVKHPTNGNKGLLKKINNLENKVNDLLTAFNSHTHVLTLSAGTGTAAPTVSPVTPSLTVTQQTDIEHPNITH